MKLRILRALLEKPGGSLTKYRIAKMVGCTPSWVIQLTKQLENKGLVKGTKVLKVDELVNYYLEIAPKLIYKEFHVTQPVEFLKKSNLKYALTTYRAENLVTHHLFPSRCDAYIKEEDFEQWKDKIIKKGLLGKGNLRLIFASDQKLFEERQNIRGTQVVSIPQLLIDLKREGGVCGEAYEMLRDEHVRRHRD